MLSLEPIDQGHSGCAGHPHLEKGQFRESGGPMGECGNLTGTEHRIRGWAGSAKLRLFTGTRHRVTENALEGPDERLRLRMM